jgi:hypothetical protein
VLEEKIGHRVDTVLSVVVRSLGCRLPDFGHALPEGGETNQRGVELRSERLD